MTYRVLSLFSGKEATPMAERLINITDPKYRCSLGACPAVYRDRTPERYRCPMGDCPAVLDDDSGNFVFIGERLDPLPEELAGKVSDTEAAVKLSADLVLSSLGVSELVEAAEQTEVLCEELLKRLGSSDPNRFAIEVCLSDVREALSRIKGGK